MSRNYHSMAHGTRALPDCAGTFKYAVGWAYSHGGSAACPICTRRFDRDSLLGPDHSVIPAHAAPTCGVGQLLADVGAL